MIPITILMTMKIYFFSGLDYLNDEKIICVTVLFVPSCVLKNIFFRRYLLIIDYRKRYW